MKTITLTLYYDDEVSNEELNENREHLEEYLEPWDWVYFKAEIKHKVKEPDEANAVSG
jgi:hypothetical protein